MAQTLSRLLEGLAYVFFVNPAPAIIATSLSMTAFE